MRSSSSFSISRSHHNHLGILKPRNRLVPGKLRRAEISSLDRVRCSDLKLQECGTWNLSFSLARNAFCLRSMDEGSMDTSSLDDLGNNWDPSTISSSEGEDSDEEVLLTPIDDCETPVLNKQLMTSEDTLTVTAQRLTMLGKRSRRYKFAPIGYRFFINVGLASFVILLLGLVDWCAWRIIRLPLDPLYVIKPFVISAVLVVSIGYVAVPLLKRFNIFREEGERLVKDHVRKRIPTMGGLYLVPVGAIVGNVLAGTSQAEVSGAIAITLAFAVVGLLDDTLCQIKNLESGSSWKMKVILQAIVAAWFSYWLETADVTTPYSMKMLIPLPSIGLLNMGKSYRLLSTLALVVMANATNLSDRFDGMSSGVAALAFVGLSIAVLPICPDLAVFGASMTGACVGFLMQNGYKASVLMGSTGSLALGGALAAMASCTGMFLPLFIASGVFMLEVLYLMFQVMCFCIANRVEGDGQVLFLAERLHNQLAKCGIEEPWIVAGTYVLSSVLAIFAGYVGLVSA
ncbi:hypothetical protein Droror1_Dr00022812 [Drosera rotundifolia]